MLTKALEFAKKAHEGQTRKSGGPYIEHPIEVAELIKRAGLPEEYIVAGYLHDILEDTSITPYEIAKHFGEEVLRIVNVNTENKRQSWLVRKTKTHQQIPHLTLNERIFIVADKLSNLRSIEKGLAQDPHFFDKFNASYEYQRWYYTSIALLLPLNLVQDEKLPAIFAEYENLVFKVFPPSIQNG